MTKRRVWSDEQDRILQRLKEEMGERKWTCIANIMKKKFGLFGRSGKQCRERYINHLHEHIINTDWTREEEEILYQLHSCMGNKWSIIAKQLPGRSDNCIKNHFYAKVRKTLRKLNKFMRRRQDGEFKLISNNLLTKILEISEQKFKLIPKYNQDVINQCNKLKNDLLNFKHTSTLIQRSLLKEQCPFETLYESLITCEASVCALDGVQRIRGQSQGTGNEGIVKEEVVKEEAVKEEVMKKEQQEQFKYYRINAQ